MISQFGTNYITFANAAIYYFLNLIFSQIFEWENEESFGIFRVDMHLKVALNYDFF
jgi:hypothetical protein